MQIITADLDNPDHAREIVALTDAYCRDPSANGAPLPKEICEQLVPALRRHPTTLVLLAFDGDEAVGIATCFLGFSTFAAKPLVNVHDLAVLPSHRGQGVGRALLAAVEERARELGCCKVTLEVQENNHPARQLYAAVGFAQSELRPEVGGALFLSKKV